MMSVQGEADYLRRSMLAGAREFLVKPFSSDELTASIRQVYSREKEKVGRGCRRPGSRAPSDAAPLRARSWPSSAPRAASGARRSPSTWPWPPPPSWARRSPSSTRSFQFGDVAVLLNLNPKDKSMVELVPELDAGGDPDSVDTFTVTHSSGINVLLAPPSPEMAELITPAGVKHVIEILRQHSDLVVVDCAAWFNDTRWASWTWPTWS